MDNGLSTIEILQEILESRAFSRLRSFKSEKKWKSLSEKERDLLGFCFVKQAEHYLLSGDQRADESFYLAQRLLPGDSRIYCQQGMIYGSYPDGSYLEEALEAFSRAAVLDARHFDTWRGWGSVLFRLGTLRDEEIYFSQSTEKFQEALNLLPIEKLDPEFFWNWGLAYYQLGKRSGEAQDYALALEKMKKAEDCGADAESFWVDYGNICSELFCLLGKQAYLGDAIKGYRKAIKYDPHSYDAWFNLGAAHHKFFELKREKGHFKSACESYRNATLIDEKDHVVWGKWAQLLSWAGKYGRHLPWLEESFEKFEKALALKPDHPVLLACHAEALLLVGSSTENHSYLRQAQDTLRRAVHLRANDSDIWCLYGECYNELGRYFQDTGYYYKAMFKFKQGLLINRTHFMLWFGLAHTFLAVGEMEQDKKMIEKAILFLSRVSEFCDKPPPMFWCQWGIAFLKLANLTQDRRYVQAAIDKLEKAISFFPEEGKSDVECLFQYGNAHVALANFDDDLENFTKAIRIFTTIVDQEPKHSKARHQLALSYNYVAEMTSDVEMFGKSHEQFQHLIAQDAEDGEAWNDWGYAILSLAELVNDESNTDQINILYNQAEHRFSQAAALGMEEAFYNMACLYSLKKEYDVAMHYLERAEREGSLPSLDVLLEEEWLDGLRKTDTFVHFYNRLLA